MLGEQGRLEKWGPSVDSSSAIAVLLGGTPPRGAEPLCALWGVCPTPWGLVVVTSSRNYLLTSLEGVPIRTGGRGPGGEGWFQTIPLTLQFSADPA